MSLANKKLNKKKQVKTRCIHCLRPPLTNSIWRAAAFVGKYNFSDEGGVGCCQMCANVNVDLLTVDVWSEPKCGYVFHMWLTISKSKIYKCKSEWNIKIKSEHQKTKNLHKKNVCKWVCLGVYRMKTTITKKRRQNHYHQNQRPKTLKIWKEDKHI